MSVRGWNAEWAQALARVGDTLTAHLDELGRDIVAVMVREVPEAASPDSGLRPLLQQMVYSNIDNVVTSIAHEVPTSELRPTTASLELARRMAEQGMPAHAVVRTYQIGHRLLLRRLLLEIADTIPAEADTIHNLAEFIDYNLGYLNGMSAAAVKEHTEADERWNGALGAAATRRLRDVISGEVHDADRASRLLGYDVEGTHLAFVLWSPNGTTTLRGLARVIGNVRGLPIVQEALAVPQDVATLLAWIRHPPGSADDIIEQVATNAREISGTCRIAVGEELSGLQGFRETHAQALAARRVAELPGRRNRPVTRYRDVAATSLMAVRPLEASAWVRTTLGRLADPGSEMAKLRETLQVYLEVGENASDAADRLYLHRNTVKTRVSRAIELLNLPFAENRLGVALALDYLSQTAEP